MVMGEVVQRGKHSKQHRRKKHATCNAILTDRHKTPHHLGLLARQFYIVGRRRAEPQDAFSAPLYIVRLDQKIIGSARQPTISSQGQSGRGIRVYG
jgi:hypothetical protein